MPQETQSSFLLSHKRDTMAMPFQVSHKEPELILPAKPTPHEIKQLSEIDDQRGLRFHYTTIMFYENNPCMRGKDPVGVIREALAKALVYYYPFAGRFFEGPNDKLMVNCTAEGVLFTEASAEVRLEQLRNMMQPPCPYSKELLLEVPGSKGMLGCPLMSIQVTRLICGGFVFAIRLNHVMGDALGLVQFLNAISQIAKGSSAPSVLPVWRRKLLTARNPPRVTFLHNEYEVASNDNVHKQTMIGQNLIGQSFFFGPKEIKVIKNHLPPHMHSCSRFDLITACIWRSRARALGVDPDEDVSLVCVVNIRGKNYLHLPSGYYGNAVVTTAAVAKAKILCNNSLGYAIEQLKKAKAQVNKDYVRSLTDFLVLHGRPRFMFGCNLLVTDQSRIGNHEVNFGWGKPIYGGTMDGGNSFNFSIYAHYRNDEGEDGVMVSIFLPSPAMERFKMEVRRLTGELLEEYDNFKHISILSKM